MSPFLQEVFIYKGQEGTYVVYCIPTTNKLHRDDVRYNYEHSIERRKIGTGVCRPGQRLSIMIRVRLTAMINVIVSVYAIGSQDRNATLMKKEF